MSDSDSDSESEYDRLRRENIARNRAVMQSLGLDQHHFTEHARHKGGGAAAVKSSPKKRERPAAPQEPSRRSSRQRGLDAETQLPLPDEAEIEERRIEMRAEHVEAERDHTRWAGRQGRAVFVGTASYQHTLHRVATMSEKALGNRVKVGAMLLLLLELRLALLILVLLLLPGHRARVRPARSGEDAALRPRASAGGARRGGG